MYKEEEELGRRWNDCGASMKSQLNLGKNNNNKFLIPNLEKKIKKKLKNLILRNLTSVLSKNGVVKKNFDLEVWKCIQNQSEGKLKLEMFVRWSNILMHTNV